VDDRGFRVIASTRGLVAVGNLPSAWGKAWGCPSAFRLAAFRVGNWFFSISAGGKVLKR